ncbi:unnamed protein product [Cladocopium goreaui]|uniref:J domain-containing protein n=1 Tax=Cladocopium goreaui TaxID=2562237 RepID=A0A9P1CIW0_9DINO|nr:unnamed protein product [Cladocopium goreaui]
MVDAVGLDAQCSMEEFLAACNQSWGRRELRAVQNKLERIGVQKVPELLRYERAGVLNDMLAAAGQRCFSSATLTAFRAAQRDGGNFHFCLGVVLAGGAALCPSVPVLSTGNSKPVPLEGENDNESDADELEELLNDFFCRASAVASRSSTREANGFDEATLRRQVNRGLSYIDEAAKEVHRRNANLSRCLEEVQADISRISERMQAARRERQRGRAATSAAAPRMFSDRQSMPQTSSQTCGNAKRRYHDEMSSHSKAASKPPTQQHDRGFTPPCPRAAKEGFSFGGWHALKPRPLANQESLQDSVRAQLASLKYETKANQKAGIKRLLVKWHPDRNLESAETATSIFQFIQQEKDKMLGPM